MRCVRNSNPTVHAPHRTAPHTTVTAGNDAVTDESTKTLVIMYEKNIVVYDYTTGNVLRMLKGDINYDHNIKFFAESLSSRCYVTAAGNESQIWDNIHGGSLGKLGGHMMRITGLLLHPNSGDLMLTCSADGTLRLWNIPNRREVCRVYESDEPLLGQSPIRAMRI